MRKIKSTYAYTRLMKYQHIISRKQLNYNLLMNALATMSECTIKNKLYDDRVEKSEGRDIHHISYYIASEKMFIKFMTKFAEGVALHTVDKVVAKLGLNKKDLGNLLKTLGEDEKEIKKLIKGLPK